MDEVGALGVVDSRESGEGTLVVVSESDENVGAVPVGTIATRTVTVQNTGSRAVQLRVKRKSCGCLDVLFEKERLLPGETAQVTLNVLADGSVLQQTQMAEIEWSEADGDLGQTGSRQSLIVAMKYTPDLEFCVFPTEIFVETKMGVAFERLIHVRPHSAESIDVHEASSTLECLEVAEIVQQAHAGRGVTIIRLRGNGKSEGLATGYVEIHTSSAQFDVIRIPVRVRTWPAVQVQPPGLAVLVSNDARIERVLRVNCDVVDRDIRVVRAVCSLDAIAVGPSEHVGAESACEWSVSIDVAGLPSANGTSEILLLDEAGEIVVKVPVSWYSG